MTPSPGQCVPTPCATPAITGRVGFVRFLNSRPLIDGLERDHPSLQVRGEVPSALLALLEDGAVDVALCPVVDYFRSRVPLRMIPAGGIACRGRTLTVRLFSRKPIEALQRVHVDSDSHTSVLLLRVLLAERYGIRPELVDYRVQAEPAVTPEAMLLIGDKVVTCEPSGSVYRHQLDLGEVWNQWTGLPFVFAIWMGRDGGNLGDLPHWLAQTRIANEPRRRDLAVQYASRHGWPVDLAAEYLGDLLHYEIGEAERAAMGRFAALANDHGWLEHFPPLRWQS